MKITKSLWPIFFMSTVFSGQEKVIFNPCSLKELACTKAAEYLLQLQQNSTLPTKIQRSLDLPIGHEHTALLKKILASDSIVHKATTRALGRFIPSPDGTKLLTISFQKVVRVIDSATGKKCLKLPKARFDFIEDAGWSPCGNYLWAYAKTMFLFLGNPKSSHLVRWWDINNGYDPQTILQANSIHFSSQQKKIILAGLNKLALYDLEKNRFVLCKEFPNYPNGALPRKKKFSLKAYEYALEKFLHSESGETPELVSLGPIDEQSDLMIVYGKEQNYLGNIPIVDRARMERYMHSAGKGFILSKE